MDVFSEGSEDELVAEIAYGDDLNGSDIINLILAEISDVDDSVGLDKWRLARLVSIAESNVDKQLKLDALQEVYADFNYPDDMISCGIYSNDGVDPIFAMGKVIESLSKRLSIVCCVSGFNV